MAAPVPGGSTGFELLEGGAAARKAGGRKLDVFARGQFGKCAVRRMPRRDSLDNEVACADTLLCRIGIRKYESLPL
jgi:hypothetical protein